ncbi:MAG TPA: Wzz/FepE/Etk N-terminal domain-containing protein [Ignavibacteriaceae bacterium]|nr:Wzz/FepE/Etk N-terminal domain-containing protein [Ignavibacteriaceae bacterium]
MAEYKGLDFLDLLVVITKWKKFLLILIISTFVISYLVIYFVIDEEFESKALIIPSDDSSPSGSITGIMKNLKDLPLGLGGSSKSQSTDLYLTIIYSRSNLENVIKRFSLMADYNLESMEKAVKLISKKIEAEVTDEDAFEITVRAKTREKSADIVNYLLEILNRKVIELNVTKSRENRIFLENRYSELKENLRIVEDSLQRFQESTGLYEAKEQLKLIAGAYTELETKISMKKIELEILENMYEKESPQAEMLRSEISLMESEFNSLKRNKNDESFLLALNSLPENMKNFLRLYRDIEIYTAILEFIVPIYEQSKLEEQKNIPVLQVIDYGVVPEKKAYPPRLLIGSIITLIVLLLVATVLIFKEIIINSNNPKVAYIVSNFNIFKRR